MSRAGAFALALAVLVAAPLLAQDPKTDPKTESVHVVLPGETLGGIAQRAEVPRVLIIEANSLKAPYALRAGQKLVIPRRRSHTVKAGETGFDVAMIYGVPWSAIAAANAIKPDAALKAGQKLAIPTVSAKPATAAAQPSISTDPESGLPDTAAPTFIWPLQGKIRRAFIAGKQGQTGHDGIDILAPAGTAVRASAAGKVIFAGQGPEEYGLTVIVWHAGRWTTTYSYLDKITVKVGDKVKATERVGLVGQTGLAEVPQLHFEVRRNKLAQDPVRYLPKAKR
ncbi:MAG: M23 family metallopeptidase [Novosphingobium sp.]|uniref:peptidoglycan DD-metalloendopeptidase family protein n=1 Tax=Novosphingobium sp. TaxID=1874826 RepID=UPI0032BBDE09